MAKKLTDLNEAEYSVILEYVELYGITEEEALKTALTEGSITEHSASNFKYKPEGFLELKYYDGNNKSVFFKLNKELKKAKKTELFETDNFYLGTEVVKLITFIISNKDININTLKDEISTVLPYYMVPSDIVKLERFPYNSNHKIDKNELINIYKSL